MFSKEVIVDAERLVKNAGELGKSLMDERDGTAETMRLALAAVQAQRKLLEHLLKAK